MSAVNCYALMQTENLWMAVNAKQILSNNQNWMSFTYAQLRFIKNTHPWQSGLAEAGIGYKIAASGTIWMGYRWVGINPNNGFIQENRLFQQYIQAEKLADANSIIWRTRLEEIERTNSSQISVRLRQRIAYEIIHDVLGIHPFLYDEIFLQLHATNYTSNKFLNDNRIFIGFNLYTRDKTWWEIGYINRFQLHTAQSSENVMSHIISLTYNFS